MKVDERNLPIDFSADHFHTKIGQQEVRIIYNYHYTYLDEKLCQINKNIF